jgi:hypothetical protein
MTALSQFSMCVFQTHFEKNDISFDCIQSASLYRKMELKPFLLSRNTIIVSLLDQIFIAVHKRYFIWIDFMPRTLRMDHFYI